MRMVVILLFLILAGCDTVEPTPNITGKWIGMSELDGKTTNWELNLLDEDGLITGRAGWSYGWFAIYPTYRVQGCRSGTSIELLLLPPRHGILEYRGTSKGGELIGSMRLASATTVELNLREER